MDQAVLRAIIARAREDADPADSDEAIVVAMGLAEDVQRDLRRHYEKAQKANLAHHALVLRLDGELKAIQDRCQHVPGLRIYTSDGKYPACLICEKELP